MSNVSSPAKINLSLRILGKGEDGYHAIDTLMASLDLADDLHFHHSRTTTILCNDPSIPTDESNLIMKAIRVFEASYGRKAKQRITLTKNIPHGAGLGGGSSNAITTLLSVNDLLFTEYNDETLGGMAAQLGSDTNFFLNPVPSRCTGRGEIVTPCPELASWTSPIVLIKPDFAVSTPLVYQNFASSKKMAGFNYKTQEVDGIKLFNDLERPAFEKFPILGLMKNWLLQQKGTRAALMSGSGSTLYALTENLEQAEAIAAAAKEKFGESLFTYCGWVNPAKNQ